MNNNGLIFFLDEPIRNIMPLNKIKRKFKTEMNNIMTLYSTDKKEYPEQIGASIA